MKEENKEMSRTGGETVYTGAFMTSQVREETPSKHKQGVVVVLTVELGGIKIWNT